MNLKKIIPFSFIFLFVLSACAKPPPVLGALPEFSFTNQNKIIIQKKDLLGKVWVADFIFTRCGGVCPALTIKMKGLVDRTKDLRHHENLKFVSFSVDPETDTPEKLQQYAQNFQVNADEWFFLTGPYQQVEAAVMKGFKISMGRDADFQVVHGEKFVLVDNQGQIRGYYDADEKGLNELYLAIKQLL